MMRAKLTISIHICAVRFYSQDSTSARTSPYLFYVCFLCDAIFEFENVWLCQRVVVNERHKCAHVHRHTERESERATHTYTRACTHKHTNTTMKHDIIPYGILWSMGQRYKWTFKHNNIDKELQTWQTCYSVCSTLHMFHFIHVSVVPVTWVLTRLEGNLYIGT